MHRIRRLEQQRPAPVATEDEEHAEEYLVAPIAEDELLRPHAPSLGEHLSKLVAVSGITVQEESIEIVRRDIAARGIGLRPFVRLDADLGAVLLRAIWLEQSHLGTRSRRSARAHLHSLTLD